MEEEKMSICGGSTSLDQIRSLDSRLSFKVVAYITLSRQVEFLFFFLLQLNSTCKSFSRLYLWLVCFCQSSCVLFFAFFSCLFSF